MARPATFALLGFVGGDKAPSLKSLLGASLGLPAALDCVLNRSDGVTKVSLEIGQPDFTLMGCALDLARSKACGKRSVNFLDHPQS